MKILQINAVYKTASTGRTCKELHDYLAAHGHECITVYGGPVRDFDDTIHMGSIFDHKTHALLSRLSGKVGYYSTLPTMRLIQYIKKNRPDIVHLRVLHSNFINIPLLLEFLGRENIATVITLHDCFFFTGKCCHYVGINCEKWKTECRDCPSYKDWNRSWFFDRTNKMFLDKKRLFNGIQRLAVVGVSDWISSEARQSKIFFNRNVQTIYNWVDLSIFQPVHNEVKNRLGISGKIMLLGVATDWGAQKGLCDFIRLAEILPPEQYSIVLIGNIPDASALHKNVISVKQTNNAKELAEYYSAADVFLQLSRQETFGKVTAEALACGTPVITYGNTANREMAFDGCGLCVDNTGDIDALLRCIKQIADTGKALYSENCRRTAEKIFDYQANCDLHMQLYRNLTDTV